MKQNILAAVIYLSGYICAYFLGKQHLVNNNRWMNKEYANCESCQRPEWSTRDRNFVLIVSVGSWASAISVGLLDVIDSHEPATSAKW